MTRIMLFRSMDFDALHSSEEAMESMAEEFIFGRLSSQDLDSYEEHLFICERCRRVVTATETFIRNLREATDGSPQ